MKRRGNVVSPVDSISTLVEQLQQTDFTVEDGEIVWVRSTACLWVYRVNSGLVADGITVVQSLYGNGGVWQRLETLSGAGVTQTAWFVDPVNGNDANNGQTAATALKTDAERQRRIGPAPFWTQAEYHIRYLNDLPTTDPVLIVGQLVNPATNIYLHGNQVSGQGKAVLASLAVDAITAQNTATNTPLKFTSNGIVTSWTADGLLNQRCRMTSGAGLGGYVWPMLDLGAKQAQMSETEATAPSSFSNPFTFPTTAFLPALNDTFVVESLVTLGAVYVDLTGGSSGASTNAVILDSLAFTGYTAVGIIAVNMVGCAWLATLDPGAFMKTLQLAGCRIKAGAIVSAMGIQLNACYFDDSSSTRCIVRWGLGLSSFGRLITVQRQGVSFRTGSPSASANSLGSANSNVFTSFGIFNNSALAGLSISGTLAINSTVAIWGVCGAGGPALMLETPGSRLVYGAAAPGAASYYGIDVTAAPSQAWIGYRNAANVQAVTVVAWDPATSTYTALRTLTKVNLQAAVGAGGFNGQFADPISQCSMTPG
jgi:hypothetical protein